ncbi:MAG: NifB/NifX family molybdenum-iron cluster-binding protein [Methanomassiliicoccales archaeon]|nr:NifB/NifX family molybdenum-iron cluster-binding protein [Methanomassiliicoccales archaeon]
MKICIPTMGYRGMREMVGEHFGKVPTYTIIDTETNEIKVIENTSEHRGGVGLPPELIKKAGADAILVSGLGMRALEMFKKLGIRVYTGAHGTVEETLAMFKQGKLTIASEDDICREHQHHDVHSEYHSC